MSELQDFLITAICRTEFQTVLKARNSEEAAAAALEVRTEGWSFLGAEHTVVRPVAIKEVEALPPADGGGAP